jgi:SAM-dependent methyltransferase
MTRARSSEPPPASEAAQAAASLEQNAEYFARDTYGTFAESLDSHQLIRRAITAEVEGLGHVLDVGNGGVFEYDPSVVASIVAVDLFLDQVPAERFPPNVTARKGDALNLDEPDAAYDAVLQTFLYHHLTGERAADLVPNVRRAIEEAGRTLRPGGRLFVAESCVPGWFYAIERAMFGPLKALARTRLLGGHPVTLQLTFDTLVGLVGERLDVERAYRIPLGRWVTQFGRRWPTTLTPVRAYVIVARKPAA